jgi:hypothetical protein
MEVAELMQLFLPDFLTAEHCPQQFVAGQVDGEFFRREEVVKQRVRGKEGLRNEFIQHLLHNLHAVFIAAHTTSPSFFLHFLSLSANFIKAIQAA